MERTKSSDRRESLSISAILNEDSVEPKGHMVDSISDSKRKRYTWPAYSFASISQPLSPFQRNAEEPMNGVPAPTASHSPPRYVTSKSDSNQILVPEEATVRQLPDGFVVCGITKGKRKRISPEQLKALLEVFEQTDTPSSQLREELAERLKMSKREVQVLSQSFFSKKKNWIA
jgi:Homeodomain